MATSAPIRLDDSLVNRAKVIGSAMNRTAPKQIEHWAKIGRMMEDNPELSYEFVKQALIAEAEREAGDLEEYSFD